MFIHGWTTPSIMRACTVVPIAVTVALAGCSRRPADISITNRSSVTLSNISVNSDHYALPVSPLSPGTSTRLVYPGSDSRGWLCFEAAGKKIESRGKHYADYFEISSRRPLLLLIGDDLTVTSSSGTKSH